MNQSHVISDEAFTSMERAFHEGKNWMAYNEMNYYLEREDVTFFESQKKACDFVEENHGKAGEHYRVIRAGSVTDVLRQIPYGINIENNLKSLNNKVMNENNYDYLKLNIKLLGFGEKQHEELEKNLREGKEAFQMKFDAILNNKPFEAVLQFKRPENSDMYFLNSYRASLERSNGDRMEQTFYLNKGKGVTAKEAYNLLEGRAVHKELANKAGEPYHAWIQLDFQNKVNNNNDVKQFHENYGYDVRGAVAKFGVKELDGGEKENNLLKSLQKGNIQSVTMEKDGTSQKMFIEANPQYKTVNVYDGNMKRVQKEDLKQYRQAQPLDAKEVKKGKAVTEEGKEVKKNSMKNNGDEESLIPKKRTRKKKGLGVS